MNYDPTQNNNHNNNNNNNDDENDFNNNISKYYWKIRKNDILCFHNFGDVIAAQCIICHPQVRKGVIELQQIISKHKHAYISTPI